MLLEEGAEAKAAVKLESVLHKNSVGAKNSGLSGPSRPWFLLEDFACLGQFKARCSGAKFARISITEITDEI